VEQAKVYVYAGLRRGIPSLFVDLKSLYADTAKRDAIEALVEAFSDTQSKDPTPAGESPTTYIWTLYFLAQHHSFLGRQQKALALVSTALEHTPTLPDLHTLRARILKRAGDPFGAARSLEDARLLDGQDRFLNTKCGKYRLRAGLVDEASEVFGMFTKVAPRPSAGYHGV
jgi:Flp pilus assembly protein TadD